MACDCKDTNGSLLDKCLGTCKASNAEQYYSQKLIDVEDNIMSMLNEFRLNLDQIEADVKDSMESVYLDGFKKGFEMAKDMYE